MISVEDALTKVLSHFRILEPERKPILDCLGQVLAEDVVSKINIPPYNSSAMDGYAVRYDDIKNASEFNPTVVRMIGRVAAGYPPTENVVPGTAIRIMTGASIPKGADTVVQFEHTHEAIHRKGGGLSSEIGILRSTTKGKNVRKVGEYAKKGDRIFQKGTVLQPREIGVLASLGLDRVAVVRRPVIAILATGDELVEVGQPLMDGKIYNANAYSEAAQVICHGGVPKMIGVACDNREDLSSKIALAMDCDLLITSGGVSMGDYDIVKEILSENCAIGFWAMKIKPGRRLAFGVLYNNGREVPCLGFSGNPVSSILSFEQFARPAILKMQGKMNFTKNDRGGIRRRRYENIDSRRFSADGSMIKENSQYDAISFVPKETSTLH